MQYAFPVFERRSGGNVNLPGSVMHFMMAWNEPWKAGV